MFGILLMLVFCYIRQIRKKYLKLLFSGIGLRQKDNLDNDAMTFAPFLLFPTPFPANEFKKAIELQPVLNELMHKVSFLKTLTSSFNVMSTYTLVAVARNYTHCECK